jgi:hypothetical protein
MFSINLIIQLYCLCALQNDPQYYIPFILDKNSFLVQALNEIKVYYLIVLVVAYICTVIIP